MQRRNCFASGAREELDSAMLCTEDTRRVYRSDGSLCYTVVTRWERYCEGNSQQWTDAAGDPVATVLVPGTPAAERSISCEGGEKRMCVDRFSTSCQWDDWPSPVCEPGSCPPR